MVLRWRSWALLCVLLVSIVLSGCVSDEPPEPEGDPGTPDATGGTGTDAKLPDPTKAVPSPSKALTKVDSKEAVFAPTWEVGQSWTYDVSGTRPGDGYTVTIGVVDDGADSYVFGADNGREFEQSLIHRGSFMMKGVQKDSLAVLQGNDYHDLIGFKRAAGETWTVGLFGFSVTLTKIGVQSVSHGAGESAGIRVEGSGEGQTFIIEYASDVEGFSLFEWSNDQGAVLKYALTGAQDSGTTGLLSWVVKKEHRTLASGGFSTLGTGFFDSDGSGTHVLLVGEANPATVGIGKIFDPDMNEVLTIQDPEEGKARSVATVSDVSGEWKFLAVSSSFLVLFLYQIEVVEH